MTEPITSHLRAFLSLDLMDETVRAKIKGIQDVLMTAGADLKLVEPGNLHFTMAFLGEIDENQKSFLCRRLASAKLPPLTISLRGVGAFPGPRKPRVVWVGVTKGKEDLERYASAALKMGIESGVEVDQSESFKPHLTVARARSLFGKENLSAKLESLVDAEVGESLTSPVRLKRSTLTPRGPVYETLCESSG